MPSFDLDAESFVTSKEKTVTPMGSREPVSHRRSRSRNAPSQRLSTPMPRKRKKFVLCFDGTGNKFSGNESDSNILKIFRMLDRNDDSQKHYYQPGIGTYVASKSLTHTSRVARIKSWYLKSKDAAVGTSFADHVMGGYRFLMRYYSTGDDLYIFGFSRGAYTARFLSEMLDHVGLLSAGNEEMCSFAWKTFSRWNLRLETTDAEKAKKKEMLDFMMAFRETFSRPVKPVRFLGLFDTVNSVPTFENAWMQRSKFPYTARSTAKVIRHAVAIDERRAKFRQDLISENKHANDRNKRHEHREKLKQAWHDTIGDHEHRANHPSTQIRTETMAPTQYRRARRNLQVPSSTENFRNKSETEGIERLSPNVEPVDSASICSTVSADSLHAIRELNRMEDSSDEDEEQDIKEVWFSGCHADIGGGWTLAPGEEAPLAHVPLVWMIREAERAGLKFDSEKLKRLNCCPGDDVPVSSSPSSPPLQPIASIPEISITGASPAVEVQTPPLVAVIQSSDQMTNGTATAPGTTAEDWQRAGVEDEPLSHFHRHLQVAGNKGVIHDVLQLNNGLPATSVAAWNMMEYLPFRRMDLQPDGSWKSITWPLPKGETRDIPDDVVIHNSVLKRMKADPKYRPGNLIVGGGGRGVRTAPSEYGMGKWKVLREEGDAVGEVWVRDGRPGPLPELKKKRYMAPENHDRVGYN